MSMISERAKEFKKRYPIYIPYNTLCFRVCTKKLLSFRYIWNIFIYVYVTYYVLYNRKSGFKNGKWIIKKQRVSWKTNGR